MPAEIKYNGSVIASVGEGKTATLNCKGKMMKGNVMVTVTKATGGGGSVGAINLANIPEVDSIDNPSEESATVVKYDGEIYLLVKEN